MLRAYEYQNGSPAQAVGHPYRVNIGPETAIWPPPQRAHGGAGDAAGRKQIQAVLHATLHLCVPVALLLVLLGASYLYADAALPADMLPLWMRNAGLSVADLILPGAWTCIHLTNRRYGPGYATAQLLAGLVIALPAMLSMPGDFGVMTMPALSARALWSFGAAFLVANLVAIVFFDAARGPRWWSAPLAASLAASFVFSAIYYPAAYAGGSSIWAYAALVHCVLFMGLSAALLAPYWLLRPAMRPVGGRNGY